MRKESANALVEMFAGAKSDGIELAAVSGYRSYGRQETLFNAEVNKVGEEKALQAVARPGSSEHQTGLTMTSQVKLTILISMNSSAQRKKGCGLPTMPINTGLSSDTPEVKKI